ncbi:hypothetical protein FSP39_002369 [Pinctada imbricata]|uniref:G-protein coupled receptors family 1 profile domain-containing protein n=1 Tax=Pinctada imbricata TaxID=66713 RepID=A0AA88XRS3_PINIB|nr:hypothetical protein FSP39_002369 [Pinctada imbricata]
MINGKIQQIIDHCRRTNVSCTKIYVKILEDYFNNRSRGEKEVEDDFEVWSYLENEMYPRHDKLSIVVAITIVYSLLFATGIVGNVCTCIVIAKNKFMHTATNYYLFNLACADLLLLTTGLPVDLYTIWSWYPWIFGEAFCVARVLFSETSTNTSILTITAFTVERYLAIVYPMKAQKMSSLHRAVRVIFSTWIIAICTAIPITIQYGVVRIKDPKNNTIPESAMCTLRNGEPIPWTFETSTCLFFILPMIFITILYTRIAIAIRRSTLSRSSSDMSTKENLRGELHAQQQARARRSVIKMLVAVVVAFFVCWAPFQAERMMTARTEVWNPKILRIHKVLFYLSGVFYFISSTINPILYSIMSLKFRQALKQTLFEPLCRRSRPIQMRRRQPFLKLVHGNSHVETIYTSEMVRGANMSTQTTRYAELELANQGSGSKHRKKVSPSPSISGSSLKSTDGMSQEEDLQHALYQIKCLDRNRNNRTDVCNTLSVN